MSLYSMEEICAGCIHALFHECCNKFCRCLINKEDCASWHNGKCGYKEIIPKSDDD